MATTALLVSTAAVAAAGGVLPFAIAQEEQASLGEEDSLADGIISDVLDDDFNVLDQQNTAEQDTANVGVQGQDSVQEQDSTQDASNTNLDSDVQIGGQLPPPLAPTPEPPVPSEPPIR